MSGAPDASVPVRMRTLENRGVAAVATPAPAERAGPVRRFEEPAREVMAIQSSRRVDMTPAAWMAALGLMAGSYDVTAISVALVRLQTLWHLTLAQTADLTAAPLVGSVVGALVAGLLADRFGRRLLLLVDFATFVMAAVLAALSTGFGPMLVWRTVMGVGIGADFAVVFPYLVETIAPARRGATMALVLWINDIGQVIAFGAGSLFVRFGVNGFRWILVIGAILGAVTLVSRSALPETAPWLGGRLHSVRSIVHRGLRLDALSKAGSSALLWFLHQVTGQGLTLFLPLIIALMWSASASQSGIGSIVVKLLSLAGGLLTVFVIDRWGRRTLQWGGFLGRGLALLPLGLIVVAGVQVPFWLAGGLLAVALACGAMGPDKTTVIATAERFPTDIRASGQGAAEMIGRLGGVSGVLLFGLFPGRHGLGLTLLVFAGVALIGAALTWLTLPETRPRASEFVQEQAVC